MSAGAVVVMVCATLLAVAAVQVYERLLATLRNERDDAYAHAEESQLLLNAILGDVEDAQQRHPASGSNLRIVR